MTGQLFLGCFFLTEFGKPYGAELQGGRGRAATVACGLWLGSGVWWYCGLTWVSYCRLADCFAEGENGVRKWVRKWVRNFRFVFHTFLQRCFFPRLPPIRFEPVLMRMDFSLRRNFSPLCPSLESGSFAVICDILRRITERQVTAAELNKKEFPGDSAYWFEST